MYLRICRATLPIDLIHRGVQVGAFLAGFDGDVVGAHQHDLRAVPVFFDFQDHVRLDDLRVIQVQALDLLLRVVVDGGRDGEMTAGDGDVRIGVGDLHGGACSGSLGWVVVELRGKEAVHFPDSRRSHRKPLAQIELAADGIVDQEILGAVAHDLAIVHAGRPGPRW